MNDAGEIPVLTVRSLRLPCLVPFCRRTCAAELGYREWICGKHWQLVDPKLRRLKALAERRRRWAAAERIWVWCRDQAVARAGMP